jgi:hypothetical protein
MTMFSPDEKSDLETELLTKIAEWKKISKKYQTWDLIFRIIILIISIAIAVCSGLAASETFSTTRLLSVFATILATVSTAISAFAFTQFDFSKRALLAKAKSDGFNALLYSLKFLDPDKHVWGNKKLKVESWHFGTPLDSAKILEEAEPQTA